MRQHLIMMVSEPGGPEGVDGGGGGEPPRPSHYRHQGRTQG